MKALALLASILFFNLIVAGQTDEFLRNYNSAIREKPVDLKFVIRLAGGKSQFQPGEIIPVELAFSSPSAKKYGFDTASYDRSGRLMIDSYIVDRKDDVADPLHDYFWKAFDDFIFGGLRSFPFLGEKPNILEFELNEWIRFDKPGKYRLFVSSHRVSLGDRFKSGSKSVRAISNVVEFEIESPDASWQIHKLSEILKTLDGGQEEQRKIACGELRFLDTKESIRQIVKRYDQTDKACDFSYYMGLQGTKHRELAIAEIEKAIDNPDRPVNYLLLQNFELLSFYLKNPGERPEYSNDQTGEAQLELWRMERNAEHERAALRLQSALKFKKGNALTISTETYLRFRENGISVAERAELLARIFWDLSESRQQAWLGFEWTMINDQSMLPILRRVYDRLSARESLDYDQKAMFTAAIRHIVELSPAEGREILISELRRERVRLDANDFGSLSPDTLLIFENDWLSKIDDSDEYLKLLEQYGSNVSFLRIREKFADQIGTMGCEPQNLAIRMALRLDPAVGVEWIRKAVDSRKSTGCFNYVFGRIPPERWSAEIEQLIVGYLQDDDLEIVKEAANSLGKNGSAEVKASLISGFESLNQRLKADPDAAKKAYGEYRRTSLESIENAFYRALLESTKWKLTDKEAEHVMSLCITDRCRQGFGGTVFF